MSLSGSDARPTKGRGAVTNAAGRFEAHASEAVDDGWDLIDDALPLRTTVTVEVPKTVISSNRSPDIPFDKSINPYRGCEHGCIYCYARPTHAYLGLSPGLDFESRLFVKKDAAAVLEKELRKPGYEPKLIMVGANTDPYQPIERDYRVTRSVLQVLADFQHPVMIATKSALVTRDIDILGPMAEKGLVGVGVSVTTLDRTVARTLEPRAATPQRRLKTMRTLADAGIPVTVLASPLIPSLNDHELEAILEASAAAGAEAASYILLRLPLELKDLFTEWLEAHAPDRVKHVLNRLKESRDGQLYVSDFSSRMRGRGVHADLLKQRFQLACRKLGLNPLADGVRRSAETSRFVVPLATKDQMSLF